jgi:hypothetical protein
MSKLIILVLIISLQSCSSLSKSKTYGAIGSAFLCGTLGAYLGKELSPNKKSESLNKVVGMSTGASLCAIGGYYMGKNLYENDPHNIQQKPIEFKPKNIIIKKPQAVIEDY